MGRHGAHEIKKPEKEDMTAEELPREENVSEEKETPKKKEKKKMSKGTKTLLIIACVILAVAVLMAGTVLVLMKIGQNALTDDGSNVDLSNKADVLENGMIRYNGKLYRYNDEVTTILLMGIDERAKTEFDGVYGDGNQSDVNVLLVMDPVNEKMTLLAISRDAMCELKVLDEEGNYLGPTTGQLALSYCYGDGAERSCELTCDAVSGILRGISVPAYGSIYMNGIADLVDLVGGVEITASKTFGSFVEGQKVTLKGDLTEKYIRPREHTTEGNNERMERQHQVLLALVNKALSSAKNDPFSIPELYRGVNENVTTNIDVSMMAYLAKTAVGLDFDNTIHNVEGESVLGEKNYAEFNIDEDALFDTIVELYYLPVEG
ncbi:MAG: LCP family protein [Bacillota bacterium]|nr:LCP family protein [Bacillota bacterium]